MPTGRQHNDELRHREGRADADARSAAERHVGKAWAFHRTRFRSKPVRIEDLGSGQKSARRCSAYVPSTVSVPLLIFCPLTSTSRAAVRTTADAPDRGAESPARPAA